MKHATAAGPGRRLAAVTTLVALIGLILPNPADAAAPPVADAGGPYSIVEGDSAVLDASASFDPDGDTLTFVWDLNDDSIFGDTSGETPTVTWALLQSLTVDDDGTYPIAVRVDDGNGGVDTASSSLIVANASPILTTVGAASVNVGSMYTLNLGAIDPGDDTVVSWTINWGDGAIEAIPGNPSSATHTYDRAGFTFNILAAVTDEDGTFLQNELLVPSFNLDRIYRFEETTGAFLQEFAIAGSLDDPIEVIIGPDGTLYVSGEKSDDVLRYNAETGAFIDTFVPSGASGLDAEGMAFGPDGHLYIASWSGKSVLRFDGTSGAFIDTFVPRGSGGLNQAYDVVFGPDDHLYVNDYNVNQVIRYDGTSGAFLDVFVDPGSGGLTTPEQMVFGPDGNLYVSSLGTDEVLRYNGTSGAFIDVFVAAGGVGDLDQPTGLAFGPDGHLYVADDVDHVILRYDGATGTFLDQYVAPGSGGLQRPDLFAFLPEQRVNVTDNPPPTFDQDLPDRGDPEGTVINLPSPATDPNSIPLAYSATGLPSGLTIDPASGLISGSIDYVAAASSPHAVDVVVTNGINPDVHDTFTWTVTNVNRAPILDPIGDQIGDEGTLVTFTASASDPDLPPDILDFTLSGLPPPGASIDQASGVFAWTPTEAQGPGAFTFDVVVTDRGTPTQADFETITVTVDEVNVAPVADPIGNQTIAELTALSFTTTGTDADLPSDTLTWSLDSGPGAVTANGDFSWVPTETDGPGTYTVTLRVTDDGGPTLSDTVAFDVDVNEVNIPPVVTNPGPQTRGEADTVSLFVLATDSDLPSNGLTWSASNLPPGLGINTASGEITGTVGLGAAAGSPYPVQVTVTDDGAPNLNGSVLFAWTIANTNHSPVLAGIGPQAGAEGGTIGFLATASDPLDIPADVLTLSLQGAPPGAAITSGGLFSWTPSEAQGPGVYAFDIVVADDGFPSLSDSETITVTISEVNLPPVLDPVGPQLGPEGSALTFNATASDSDLPANALTFSLSGAVPPGASIAPGGGFSWTPTESQGPGVYSFDIVVTDDGSPSLTASETIVVTVTEANVMPVLDPIGAKAGAEGTLLAFTATASDSDLPTNGLSFSLGGAVPAGASITGGGAFTWIPTEAQGPGVYAFDIVVSDDGSPVLAASETVTFTIAEINTGPALSPIGAQSGQEGSLIAFTASASDADNPANGLTFALSGTVPAGASITTGGSFSWNPAEAQGPGVFAFDIVVTDDGNPSLAAGETVTFTIAEVNSAPAVMSPGDQLDGESDTVSLSLTATDIDLPVNTFAWTAVGLPLGLGIDPGTGVVSGTVSSIAAALSPYAVTISVTDGGVPILGGAVSFQWTITDTNRSPILDPIGPQVGDELALITFTAIGSDPDINGLTFSLEGAVPAGAAIDPATGVLTWVATETQGPGAHVFDVVVTDDGVPSLSARETITVLVGEVNTAPLLTPPGIHFVAEQAPFSVAVTATDADLPSNVLTFSLAGAVPSGAVVDPTTGVISWTPSETEGSSSYLFDVIATDDGIPSLSDVVSITIIVTEANRPPLLDPIGSQTVDEHSTLIFTATASDPDDPVNALRFSLGGVFPDGAAIDAVTGVFTWTPGESDGPGPHTFEVIVTDDGAPAMADRETITVTVLEVNTAPNLDPIEPQNVDELVTLTFTATGSDLDQPMTALTFSLGGAVPTGAAIDPITGVFTWTPGETQGPAMWVFDIVITDSGTPAMSGRETITVTVHETNAAPVLDPLGRYTIDEHDTLILTVTANDTDTPADTLRFSLSGVVPAGAVIDRITGVFSWAPTAEYVDGTYEFTVVVTDDGSPALSHSTTIAITVSAARAAVLPAVARAATDRKQEIVVAMNAVAEIPDGDEPAASRLSFVVMARAAGGTAAVLGPPLWLLLAALVAMSSLGRIGLAPIIRRGKRIVGSLAWFDQATGYGYIVADGTGAEAFVHVSTAPWRQRSALTAGRRVSYRVVEGPNRDFAAAVRLIESGST